MIDALNIALALLIVGLGIWTVVAREAFAAVAGFICYGLFLTLAWVQLDGIDVALTEAAIGGGLTGALLIGAAARLRASGTTVRREPIRPWVVAVAALVSGLTALALGLCFYLLPVPAPTLAPQVVQNIASTGVGNPITAVLLSFRAMDTLLEAIVLVFAIIGVWSLTADESWNGRPGRLQQVDPNGTFAHVARILPPIGIIVGSYVFWMGADYPGGKFQGATILAAMWLLVIMAGLAEPPAIGRTWLRFALVVGPLLFIAVGVVGVIWAGAFLAYPEGLAKPLILVVEFALMPTLTLILALLLVGVPRRGGQP